MEPGAPSPGQALWNSPASGGNKASKLKAIEATLRTAKRVWLATDCDREGQLIGQEILEHYNYRGEVRRVMFTAQDARTIRDAFTHARPNSEHAALYQAAVVRRQGDQIYDLSLTRTANLTLARARTVIGVGRVKTPTLGIVCRRELESRDFVVQSYFEMVAAAAATATVAAGAFRMRHAPKERMTDRAKAEAVAVLAAGATGPLSVKVEDKIGRRRICRTCRRCRSCARPASAGQLPIPWRWRRSCVTVLV